VFWLETSLELPGLLVSLLDWPGVSLGFFGI
jgi:hypothetical protein